MADLASTFFSGSEPARSPQADGVLFRRPYPSPFHLERLEADRRHERVLIDQRITDRKDLVGTVAVLVAAWLSPTVML